MNVLSGVCTSIINKVTVQWMLRALIVATVGTASGCAALYDSLGGPYKGPPQEAFKQDNLTSEARQLINKAFEGYENTSIPASGFADKAIADYHVHYFGTGKPAQVAGCENLPQKDGVHLNFEKFRAGQKGLLRKMFFKGVFLDAADISDEEQADAQYIDRLVQLIAWFGPPGQQHAGKSSPYQAVFYVMGIDGVYDKENGELDKSKTLGYVTNEYMIELKRCLDTKLATAGGFVNNRIEIVGSINPYRKDWEQQIQILKGAGVKYIKWRSPTMQFDPVKVSPEFYAGLKQAGIGLLVHTGKSEAVKVSDELNDFADPLRLQKAVDAGVKVIMLHIGREGRYNGKGQLFSERYHEFMRKTVGAEQVPYGEISAVPYTGTHGQLEALFSRKLAERTVNGSDYPAITPYIISPLVNLESAGLISEDEKFALELIYRYNPLLFDFVLKRTIRINYKKLPETIFLQK